MASRALGLRALPRAVIADVLARIDRWYQGKFRLQSVGPVLLVGCETYQGPTRTLADGSELRARDSIGVLHFNNLRIALLSSATRQGVAVRFARLFRESLTELARRAEHGELAHVSAFHGVTWFKAHGRKVGFVSEPLPRGVRSWWLKTYFRLLAWGFAPIARRKIDVAPRAFWITRAQLIRHFGTPPQ